ncbi:MAG: hypothetical protein WBC19_12695 [Pyrinomonadaceae bacterium]|nr:hypothetical protein [Chloracidobacterium sp.]
MTFLILFLISVSVPLVISLLDRDNRRYYYFGLTILIAGGMLGLWGYQSSSKNIGEFHRQSVDIFSVRLAESGGAFRIETNKGTFWVSTIHLDVEGKSQLSSPNWEEKDVKVSTITPTDDWLVGIDAQNFRLDPEKVLTAERYQDKKYMYFGIGMFVFGIVFLFLNYLSLNKPSK